MSYVLHTYYNNTIYNIIYNKYVGFTIRLMDLNSITNIGRITNTYLLKMIIKI